jgi:hypothetical protein
MATEAVTAGTTPKSKEEGYKSFCRAMCSVPTQR